MDSVPTLFITGQVKTALRGTQRVPGGGRDRHHAPIVKHSIAVERPDDVAQAVRRRAAHRDHRPAGAGADRPADRHRRRARARDADARAVPARLPAARSRPNGRQVRWRAPRRSRPRGGRCSTRAAASCTPARRTSCGRSRALAGAAGDDDADGARRRSRASDPQWLGMLGMHGTGAANWAMDEADLIVAVGARFDDRVTGALDEFAPRREDRAHRRRPGGDRQERRRARPDRRATRKLALAALADAYDGSATDSAARRWWQRIDGWRARTRRARRAATTRRPGGRARRAQPTRSRRRDRHHRRRPAPDVGGQPPALRRARGAGSPPAGSARWASACRPRSAPRPPRPDATVVCVTGEGSFLMNVQELATAVAGAAAGQGRRCSTTRSLGMVRQQQDMFWGGRRSAVDLGATPDWPALAAAFGVKSCDDIESALAARRPRRWCASRSIRTTIACRCSAPAGRPGR